jgi:hypothetical protein
VAESFGKTLACLRRVAHAISHAINHRQRKLARITRQHSHARLPLLW